MLLLDGIAWLIWTLLPLQRSSLSCCSACSSTLTSWRWLNTTSLASFSCSMLAKLPVPRSSSGLAWTNSADSRFISLYEPLTMSESLFGCWRQFPCAKLLVYWLLSNILSLRSPCESRLNSIPMSFLILSCEEVFFDLTSVGCCCLMVDRKGLNMPWFWVGILYSGVCFCSKLTLLFCFLMIYRCWFGWTYAAAKLSRSDYSSLSGPYDDYMSLH